MKAQYIAGFFDGEGNINKVLIKGRVYYQLRIYQGGVDGLKLLKDIQQFLDYGKIYKKSGIGKDIWELTIMKKSQILDFKKRIGKFCRIKKFPPNKELQYNRKFTQKKPKIKVSRSHKKK